MRIGLRPVGPVPRKLLAELAGGLAAYGVAVDFLPGESVPAEAFDPGRHRYHAEAFLPRREPDALAVTTADIFTEGYDFIFGLANTGTSGAVVSVHRLIAADPRLSLERVLKECVHELGHTWGLGHCDDPTCVMAFSSSLAETDAKGDAFCETCRRSLPSSVHSP